MVDQALAIDVGGSKTSWALVGQSFEILEFSYVKTPNETAFIIEQIEDIINHTMNANNISGVGIGIAGVVDFKTGTITAAPNLPLAGLPLGARLEDKFKIKCRLENDGNLAVLGEMYNGSVKGKRHIIGLTIGTGIGGGVIINGELWRGAKGAAGEFGHMIIQPDGQKCGCGNIGCWETLASGTALERAGREVAAANPESLLGRSFNADFGKLTGDRIMDAAVNGDKQALSVVTEFACWLGTGIGSLINIFDPEIVIVGGGVAPSLKNFLNVIHQQTKKIVVDPRSNDIPICLSSLKNHAGLFGAAGLVFHG